MWENGSIPTELGCTVLVMIPKGNTDTRGIGLLGVVWKVVEAVIDTRIKTGVQFEPPLTNARRLQWTSAGSLRLIGAIS